MRHRQLGPPDPDELCRRSSPRLLCTAARQKNSGPSLEEDSGPGESKGEPAAAEKSLREEKVRLEEQLRETTVRPGLPCWPCEGVGVGKSPAER